MAMASQPTVQHRAARAPHQLGLRVGLRRQREARRRRPRAKRLVDSHHTQSRVLEPQHARKAPRSACRACHGWPGEDPRCDLLRATAEQQQLWREPAEKQLLTRGEQRGHHSQRPRSIDQKRNRPARAALPARARGQQRPTTTRGAQQQHAGLARLGRGCAPRRAPACRVCARGLAAGML